jgi:predicted Zn-ribbon and HTH transcriptional regulator
MDQVHAPNCHLKLKAHCFAPGRLRAAAQLGR